MLEHKEMLAELKRSQEAERDSREESKECHAFLALPNGQWEQQWWDTKRDEPRYTLDHASPIVKQISNQLSKADFSIKVKPSGGEASKETAEVLNGLIRNILNKSNSNFIFNHASRNNVVGGLGGWGIRQKYVDDDCFDQDLVIEYIPSFSERVWLDCSSVMPDGSDARYGWQLTGVTRKDYEEQWPDGAMMSVDDGKISQVSFYQPDMILVGEYFYIRKESRDLVLMSNGRTYEDNDKFKAVRDELLNMGVEEVNRRSRAKSVVYSRKFDESDWLEDEKRTVFSYIPLIPEYANFEILENKKIFFGAVRPLKDPARIINYSMSREVSEGALAPRDKYFMTARQVKGYQDSIATMNTNNDPVQLFNADPDLPGVPQRTGGAQINAGLRNITESVRSMMPQISGIFASNMGDNPSLQSGVAIENLQERGDVGTSDYFDAHIISLEHTCKILVDAIPRVYDGKRQVSITGEDGSDEAVTLNDTVIDEETGDVVELNNLSQGSYSVVCSVGKSFSTRQQESNAAILEMAQVDPTLVQMGSDVLLGNISTQGTETLAKRKRAALLKAGEIPPEEFTDEEKQAMQAAQQAAAKQPPQQDPMMLAAQAQMTEAQAKQMQAQVDVEKVRLESQRVEIQRQELQLKIEEKTHEAQNKDGSQAIDVEEARADIEAKTAKAERDKAEAAQTRAETERINAETAALKNGMSEVMEWVNSVQR